MSPGARALALGLLAAACATAPPPQRAPAAPPAAAQVPGFRALTPTGVELVYDPAHRAYAVPSLPGAFWLDGRYFRRAGEGWESSSALEGPWQACAGPDLPPGLRGAP
ncbi:MAG TPA: hypothetical protein VEI82_06695 [Myxococcota bacterium]|nr:hypothetical protein [Myxococcota bacterium]